MTLAITVLATAAIDLLPMEWAVFVWTGLAALGGAVK